MRRKKEKIKLHYGWLIVLAGALLFISNLSLTVNIFSVYLIPLQEKLNVTSAQVGILTSIQTLTGVVMFALSGTLYSRFSLRFVCVICGCFPALGYLIYYNASSLSVCYLAAVCLGIGYGGATMVPISLLINNWFRERKATALAVASMGTGFSTIVFPPLLSSLISNNGVDSAFLFLACVIFLLMLITLLIVRDTPQSKKMLPYGAVDETAVSKPNSSDEEIINIASPSSRLRILQTGHFRLYMLACLLFGATVGPLMVRLSPIVQSFGFSAHYGALMVSLCGGALILGKFCYGILNDRFGSIKTTYFIFFIWFSGLLLYFSLSAVPVLTPIFVFLLGFSMAHGTLSLPIWSMDLYGPIHYTKLLSYAKTMYTIGNSVGMLVPGFVMDHFQNYHLAIAFFFFSSAIAFLILLRLYRHPLTFDAS